ncbi:MAG: hypothetical protein EOO24_09335 [Comamonadaceae bacterium]|nr:MAG: hypothetical protein EOO24_09335 [Comamonadaceae bacterium]
MHAMPLRALLAFLCLGLLSPGAVLHAAGGPPPSPLGLQPAEAIYLGNDSPFVLFDVAPRTIERRAVTGPADPRWLTIAFLAVDSLHSVHVTPFVSNPVTPDSATGTMPGAANGMQRVSCGARIAGHHTCSVPIGELLATLRGKEERIGLRIEAEGLDGDRSTVEVSVPVIRAKGVAPPRRARGGR